MRAHAGIRARQNAAAVHRRARGLTLIELLITLAIIAVLAGAAIPKYNDYRERIRVVQAITDIGGLNVRLRHYMVDNNHLPPPDLNAINAAAMPDPWGNAYVYLNLRVGHVIGSARKNKNLVPINSDFDLYSKGKDGVTAGPLTAGPSRDDVILASDGRFIGLVSDYE
jgi:general secretion pathway protein G